MRKRTALLALTLVTIVGCGKGSDDVSETARNELQPRVAEIRHLADARQADRVQAKLDELRGLVEDLRARGELSDEGIGAVLAAAGDVTAQLQLITTTSQPPPPRDHEDEDDEEHEDD